MKLSKLWLGISCVFAFSGVAQIAPASELATSVVNQARAYCKSFYGGILETDLNEAIFVIDVTGDGKPEEVIDASYFKCPTALTLFCGSGGCSLTVIVKNQHFEFLAKSWKVEKTSNGKTRLKMAVHWTECDYKPNCWETVEWDGKAFKSLGSKSE